MSSTIDAIKAEVEELKGLLEDAKNRLHAAQLEAAPVKIGMTVLCKGEEYRVVEVLPKSWGGKEWVIGNPKKQDGTWGIARRHLYDRYEMLP